MFKISDRILNLEESQTLNTSAKAKRLREKGFDVIDLSLGETDLFTPDLVKQSANLS